MRKLNNKELENVKGGAMNCFVYNLALLFGNLSYSDKLYWKKKCS